MNHNFNQQEEKNVFLPSSIDFTSLNHYSWEYWPSAMLLDSFILYINRLRQYAEENLAPLTFTFSATASRANNLVLINESLTSITVDTLYQFKQNLIKNDRFVGLAKKFSCEKLFAFLQTIPNQSDSACYKASLNHISHLLSTISLSQTYIASCSYKKGGYASYYKQKGEYSYNSDYWQQKQKAIHAFLLKQRPKTAIDLGANTGWYSILAAQMGTEVIAVDTDDEALSNLYKSVNAAHLPVMPLVSSFEHFIKQAPPPTNVVLCLALIHHLVLVAEHSLDGVISSIATITHDYAIIEFIDLYDKNIQAAVTDINYYFKNKYLYDKFIQRIHDYGKGYYNLDHTLQVVQQYFSSYTIEDSYPASSRKLIICKK